MSARVRMQLEYLLEHTAARFPDKPALVCGESNRPIRSKSDITLRIVAADRFISSRWEIVLEPTGSPVSK